MKTISFHINGFWFHVDVRSGRDQHGDRWKITDRVLIHESGLRMVKRERTLS